MSDIYIPILGLGTISTQDSDSVTITGGTITGITDLAIADGGTGASTASGARTALGLGTIATQSAASVAITGGTMDGVSLDADDLDGAVPLTKGGTGGTTAGSARTNLGLGTLATQSTISSSDVSGQIGLSKGGTGAATAAAARTALSLGTMALQDEDSVSISDGDINADALTSGTIPSVSRLPTVTVAKGGSGATTASGARTAFGLGTMATQASDNVSITGGTVAGVSVSSAAASEVYSGSSELPETLDATKAYGSIVTNKRSVAFTLIMPTAVEGMKVQIKSLALATMTVQVQTGDTVDSTSGATWSEGLTNLESLTLMAYADNHWVVVI